LKASTPRRSSGGGIFVGGLGLADIVPSYFYLHPRSMLHIYEA